MRKTREEESADTFTLQNDVTVHAYIGTLYMKKLAWNHAYVYSHRYRYRYRDACTHQPPQTCLVNKVTEECVQRLTDMKVRVAEQLRPPTALLSAGTAAGAKPILGPAAARMATAPTKTFLILVRSGRAPYLAALNKGGSGHDSLRSPHITTPRWCPGGNLWWCWRRLVMTLRGERVLAGAVRGRVAAALRSPAHRCSGMAAGPQAAWARVQTRSFGLYDDMLAMAGRMETAQATRRPVPVHIVLPDYATTGTPNAKLPKAQWMVEQHSDADIELARVAGRISREVLDEAAKAVASGVTTDEIDRVVHEETIKRGAYPSPLNYHGFPRSVCTSINEVVCHGIPENRTLKEGDIINIDVSCYFGDFHGDNSEMFCVGEVDDAAKKLIQVC